MLPNIANNLIVSTIHKSLCVLNLSSSSIKNYINLSSANRVKIDITYIFFHNNNLIFNKKSLKLRNYLPGDSGTN